MIRLGLSHFTREGLPSACFDFLVLLWPVRQPKDVWTDGKLSCVHRFSHTATHASSRLLCLSSDPHARFSAVGPPNGINNPPPIFGITLPDTLVCVPSELQSLQNSWDIAAGALLIQEAGGEMTDILGSPYSLSTRAIIGSNKLVHEDIREVLVAAEATRPDATPQL